MSQQKNKIIRKEIRKAVQDDLGISISWIKYLPLKTRIKYAVKIIRGKKG
uniref:Uncharacterized protein n=1 Tax=viral metagenome TaxID=1070528 RepID=A0A6H1ZBW3_9ZZZZ